MKNGYRKMILHQIIVRKLSLAMECNSAKTLETTRDNKKSAHLRR